MHPFKRILASLVALLAIGVGVVAVTAQPAAASYSECTFGQGCVYIDGNGGDPLLKFAYSVYGGSGVCWDMPANFRNTISSSVETYGNGHVFHFYPGLRCTGIGWVQPDDTEAEWGGTHNDNIESFRID
jgi:hypothetical protein